MNTLNKRSLDNLQGVHPYLIKVLEEAIKECPIEFTITEGVRTLERQKEYYSWGRMKPNPNTGKMTTITSCDGINKKSNHQVKSDGYGYAVDLYANPINVNDTVNIKVVADHIKKIAKRLNINIEWGGDWKMKDLPHFEVKL